MQDRVEEYELGGKYLSYVATRGIVEFLVWAKYCTKFKIVYKFYFNKNVICSLVLCERLRLCQPLI